jgi:hypothetical protein
MSQARARRGRPGPTPPSSSAWADRPLDRRGDAAEYLRVTGDQVAPLGARPYTWCVRDTTLLVPRWNSSGTQTTVVVLQNSQTVPSRRRSTSTTPRARCVQTVGISVQPQRRAGAEHRASLPLWPASRAPRRSRTTARFGGLAGKAVALEPATGFTFDTVIAPIPY